MREKMLGKLEQWGNLPNITKRKEYLVVAEKSGDWDEALVAVVENLEGKNR